MSDELQRRMIRLPREKRWGVIRQMQELIAHGENDRAVMRAVREEHGVSLATAYRFLGAAYADWNRARRALSRDRSLGIALARLRRSMQLALARKRHIVVAAGRVEAIDDPDVRVFLAATVAEAKLLGLFDSDARDSAIRFVERVIGGVVDVVCEEITDVDQRLRLIGRFRRLVGSREAGAGTTQDVVVDAAR